MNPRVIATAGSLKGKIFALAEEDCSIGRDATNTLQIGELAVSRHHCLIRKEADQYKVVDLDSFNGTFVNGVPVKEQSLAHGDEIAVGEALLLFLIREEETETDSTAVLLDEKDLAARSTIQLQRKDALYLHPEKVQAALPPSARVARHLNTLLKISSTINAVRSLETLQEQLLEAVLEAIPAERAAVLLANEGRQEFVSACGRNRLSGAAGTIHVSRTVAKQVLREGAAVLSNDVVEDSEFGGAASLIASQVCSLMCAPLVSLGTIFGVIYLDTSDPSTVFDEDHLQLLTAIAGIASVALENVRHLETLKDENRRLHEELGATHNLIGESASTRKVCELIKRIAPRDSTVLIRGESGTGKELAARAVHAQSARRDNAFVAINCATLTEHLLESELFGHEKGAFTGAVSQKKGKLEVAERGTVFLDEVGELPLTVQAKLLRVLQEREFERVGSTRPIKVDVRVVAATNRNLEEAVRCGSFRKDLYYRLNVVSFVMPPLSERREDIPLLAKYFVSKYSKKCGRKVTGISPEARACLLSYDWPGNIRELENAVERAVVLGATDHITLDDLPDGIIESSRPDQMATLSLYDAIKETKKRLVLTAIEQSGRNYTEAAKILGVHPNNLHRLIRALGLKDLLSK